MLLQEALQLDKIASAEGDVAEQLAAEKDLQSSIIYAEKQLFLAKQKNELDTAKIAETKATIFQLKK